MTVKKKWGILAFVILLLVVHNVLCFTWKDYDDVFAYHVVIKQKMSAGKYHDAIRILTRLAEGDYVKAQTRLGRFYLKRGFEKKHYKKALYWLEKASAQGDPKAKCYLASMYEDEVYVKSDCDKIMSLYGSALDDGFEDAEAYVANLYIHGICVERDYEKALGILSELEKKENIVGQIFLATMYDEGLGVKVDKKKAYSLYYKSRDDDFAQLRIAMILMEIGGEKNLDEAQSWLKQSALQGNKNALKLLKNATGEMSQ